MSKYLKGKHPDPLFDVVSYDGYDVGEIKAFLSASKLTISPRQFWLEERHGIKTNDLPVQPLENAFDIFIGNAVHFYFEHILKIVNKSRYSVEKRLYYDIDYNGEKIVLAGKYDTFDKESNMLYDIKTMSVSKYQASLSNPEYLDSYYLQLHFNRFLLEHGYLMVNGEKIYPKVIVPSDNLKLIAILKDYDSKSYSNNYPSSPFQTIDVPELDNLVIKEFLYAKINELKQTESLTDEELPECNIGYRFQRPTTYPVFKLTQKGTKPVNERAMPGTADFRSEEEAMIYINNHKDKDSLYYSKRASIPTRCLKYCDIGQAGFCSWINNWKEKEHEQNNVELYRK